MKIYLIAHALIVDEQGKVLVIRRSKDNDVLPSVWDIPGGSCEPGEDPVLAAIREIKEEAGLVVHNLRLLTHTSNVDVLKDTQFVRLIFQARYEGGEIQLHPREHQAFSWVDPKSPGREPLVDYLPNVLKIWLERKKS